MNKLIIETKIHGKGFVRTKNIFSPIKNILSPFIYYHMLSNVWWSTISMKALFVELKLCFVRLLVSCVTTFFNHSLGEVLPHFKFRYHLIVSQYWKLHITLIWTLWLCVGVWCAYTVWRLFTVIWKVQIVW